MASLVEIPQSKSTATLEVLAHLGITQEHFKLLRSDPLFAKRVAEFMMRGGQEEYFHYEFAKATLGNKNFFGPEDWSEFFGVNFSEAELKKIMHFPCGPHTLKNSCPFGMGKIHNTHFAFLGIANIGGVPLTIKKWSELYPRTSESLTISFYDSVLEEPFFTKETCEFRWYLSKVCPVGDNNNDRFSDQIRKLPPEYEPSRAIEELTKNILVFVKNGHYKFGTRARCKDVVNNTCTETHPTVSSANNRDGFSTTPFIFVENHDSPNHYGGTIGFEPPLAVSRKLP